MTGLFTVIDNSAGCNRGEWWRLGLAAILCCMMSLSGGAVGQASAIAEELQQLTEERELLVKELEQYKKTVQILHKDGTPSATSRNASVRKLAQEMVALNKQIIAVTEREVALLQEQIASARDEAASNRDGGTDSPDREQHRPYTLAEEEQHVARLLALLTRYYTELRESEALFPSADELAQREEALSDADKQAKIPFSADKVKLSGSEGSTALTRITERLTNPDIPESRRDITPICSIKTRLFGSLIASENRSLKPVGKNNYVARVRLQPGKTVVKVQGHRWEIKLPEDANAGDYLLTLYKPRGAPPEFHAFPVADLLAEENPHIPPWLPVELQLTSRS